MKPIVAAMLAVLAASSASALTPLARKYAVKREAVVKDFSAKRRTLLDSPAWELLSPEKRRAALDALAAEAMARDGKLTAEYDAERRRSRTGEDAFRARIVP
jgi:hypothetical protein